MADRNQVLRHDAEIVESLLDLESTNPARGLYCHNEGTRLLRLAFCRPEFNFTMSTSFSDSVICRQRHVSSGAFIQLPSAHLIMTIVHSKSTCTHMTLLISHSVAESTYASSM